MSVEKFILETRKKYPDIIQSIRVLLESQNILFSLSGDSEIRIPNRKKMDILKIVYSLPISETELYTLVEVIPTKKCVYIRKKKE